MHSRIRVGMDTSGVGNNHAFGKHATVGGSGVLVQGEWTPVKAGTSLVVDDVLVEGGIALRKPG
eukprot:8680552-Alexandrium_andersonii.AAC.1